MTKTEREQMLERRVIHPATYEITNELTGENIRVSGITIRECQSKAARKIRNNGWANEDIYHSDRIEPKSLIARIISRIGEK